MRIDGRVKSRHSSKVEHSTSKRVDCDEKSAVTEMLRNDHETKDDMDSISKPIADEKLISIAKDLETKEGIDSISTPIIDEKSAGTSNVVNEEVDLDIASRQKHTADEKLTPNPKNKYEAGADTSMLIKATANEDPPAAANFQHGHEVEVCTSISGPNQQFSNVLPCPTSMKHPLSAEEMKIFNVRLVKASGSGISECSLEDGDHGARDISVDEGVPLEDKLLICTDHDVCVEKTTNITATSANESYFCGSSFQVISDQLKKAVVDNKLGSGLENKESAVEEHDSFGLDVNQFTKDGLPYSELKKTTQDDKGVLEEALILQPLNAEDKFYSIPLEGNQVVEQRGTGCLLAECSSECATLSSEKKDVSENLANKGERHDEKTLNSAMSCSTDCLDVRLESTGERGSCSVVSFVETGMVVPDNISMSGRNRANEVEFSACGVGTGNNNITSDINCAKDSSKVNGQIMKDKDCSPHNWSLESDINKNVNLDSSNKFQLQTNSLTALEEDQTQLVVDSSLASAVSHSVLSAGSVRDQLVVENLSEVTGSPKHEQMTPKAAEDHTIDLGLGQQCLSGQTVEADRDRKTAVAESYPEKDGNSTYVSYDSGVSEKSLRTNVSTPALVDSEATKNVDNQRQRSVGSTGIVGNPVGQARSSEIRWNVSTQSLHEAMLDVPDKVNGNNDVAEMGNYTHSGPIPLSGPISHSGPIPYSGSVSLRSDSSTASTRSFAFPILSSEWNSSPVKMVQADSRYFKKSRRWRFCCFCCRS